MVVGTYTKRRCRRYMCVWFLNHVEVRNIFLSLVAACLLVIIIPPSMPPVVIAGRSGKKKHAIEKG